MCVMRSRLSMFDVVSGHTAGVNMCTAAPSMLAPCEESKKNSIGYWPRQSRLYTRHKSPEISYFLNYLFTTVARSLPHQPHNHTVPIPINYPFVTITYLFVAVVPHPESLAAQTAYTEALLPGSGLGRIVSGHWGHPRACYRVPYCV
jgi:hypothetical protein